MVDDDQISENQGQYDPLERGRFVYGTDGLRRKRFDRECRTGSEQLFGRDGGVACRVSGESSPANPAAGRWIPEGPFRLSAGCRTVALPANPCVFRVAGPSVEVAFKGNADIGAFAQFGVNDADPALVILFDHAAGKGESEAPSPGLVVKPGSKIRFQLLLGIPLPVSLMSIITCLSSEEISTSIRP